MKKIISLLTAIALSLSTFVCYAEGSEPENVVNEVIINNELQVDSDVTQDDADVSEVTSVVADQEKTQVENNEVNSEVNSEVNNDEFTERELWIESVKEYRNKTNSGDFGCSLCINTRSDELDYIVPQDFSTEKLADWMGKIYDYAYEHGKKVSRDEFDNIDVSEQTQANYFHIRMGTKYPIHLSGNELSFANLNMNMDLGALYFHIEEPASMIDFIKSILNEIGYESRNDNVIIKYKNIDLDSMSYEKGDIFLVERMTFQIETDDSFHDSFMENIASPETSVDCKIEQLQLGTSYVHILTLKGDVGTKSYCSEDAFGGLSLNRNFIDFTGRYVFDGNDILLYDEDASEPQTITLTGKTSKDGKPTAEMTVSFGAHLTGTGAIELKNIEYEFYGKEDSMLHQNRNLSVLFGLTREKLVEEAKKTQTTEEQDPERWVTKWKGVDANGDPIGYYVNFAAQFDMKIGGNTMPDWYKELGDNVTATMPVLIRTYKGVAEKKINHPFMLFKGDKGHKWFMISESGVSDGYFTGEYKNGKNPEVDIVFSEVISFDGYNVVRNTIEYEQISAYIRYSDDGNLTPLGMELRVGGKSQYTEADDITYIGEGGLSFENIG